MTPNLARENESDDRHVPVDSSGGLLSLPGSQPAPTLEEINAEVTQTHQKLVELQRLKEELDRKRAALEELKRKRVEFQVGRDEVSQKITRALELLDQAKLKAEREAEQIGRTIDSLKEALERVKSINESGWTAENFQVELARALAAIEQARLEWGAARRKHPFLDEKGSHMERSIADGEVKGGSNAIFPNGKGLWKVGLALTWPLVLCFLVFGIAVIVLLLRK